MPEAMARYLRSPGAAWCCRSQGPFGTRLLDDESKIDLPIPGQLETQDASATWLPW